MNIGHGWDRHRLEAGRPLMLGGVHIPWHKGEAGHSDGDVLLHAVIDALLGSCALGDIGYHFPPGDPAWKDAASAELLRQACDLVMRSGFRPTNIDSTIILESPKLTPHIQAIRRSIAELTDLPVESVSVKAKTAEGFPPVGTGDAVEAHAVVLTELLEEDQSLYL